jgi:hypothetical protein
LRSTTTTNDSINGGINGLVIGGVVNDVPEDHEWNMNINIKNGVKSDQRRVSKKILDDENFFLSLDDTCDDVEKFVEEGIDLLFQCSRLN